MVSRIEITWKVDSLEKMTPLVRSPSLNIDVGLVISVILGAQVFSIANYQLEGIIKIEDGTIIISGNKIKQIENKSILFPISFYESVTCGYFS